MIHKPEIVGYIKRFLPLTKKGKSWWACCPFHGETQPSFTVSQDEQVWFCFGCQQGGDVISFIEKYHKTDFAGALDIIGHKRPKTKREGRRLALEIKSRQRAIKRLKMEIKKRDEQQKNDFMRLAELDELITLTKNTMKMCRNMSDIDDISLVIQMLPEWEYERDCLLYIN